MLYLFLLLLPLPLLDHQLPIRRHHPLHASQSIPEQRALAPHLHKLLPPALVDPLRLTPRLLRAVQAPVVPHRKRGAENAEPEPAEDGPVADVEARRGDVWEAKLATLSCSVAT